MRMSLDAQLTASDRAHLRKIVGGAGGQETVSKVGAFLRERTYVDAGAATAFAALRGEERERLLSELVWRLTCVLDGSETATLGSNLHRLSAEFSALFETDAGGEFCTVRRDA